MLLNLDNDTFGLVCEFLDVKDVGALTCTNKVLKKKIWKHDTIWFTLYERAYHQTKDGHTNAHKGDHNHECFLHYDFVKKTYTLPLKSWMFIKQNKRDPWVTITTPHVGTLIDYAPSIRTGKTTLQKYRDDLNTCFFDVKVNGNVEVVDEIAKRTKKCVNNLHRYQHKVEYKSDVDYKKKYKKMLAKQYKNKKITGDLKIRLETIDEKIKKLERERTELLRTARMIEFAKKYNK